MTWWRRETPKRELPDWMSIPWPWWQGLVALPAWLGVQFAIVAVLDMLAPYFGALNNFINQAQSGQQLSSQVGAYLLEVLAGVIVIGYYLWRYKVGPSTVGWRKFNVM